MTPICRSHGFVCLWNTGISKQGVKTANLKLLDPCSNTGYCGFEGESLNRRRRADLKEVFNIGNPNVDGYDGFVGTSQEFQDAATEFWMEITLLSKRFAQCCAIALGLEIDYFTNALQEYNLSTCRMLHYPPLPACDSDEGDPGSATRVGEHTDFGIFTFFLFIDN